MKAQGAPRGSEGTPKGTSSMSLRKPLGRQGVTIQTFYIRNLFLVIYIYIYICIYDNVYAYIDQDQPCRPWSRERERLLEESKWRP